MLDPRIIMQGQTHNALSGLQQAQQAAVQTKALQKQNHLAQLYQQHGAGIARGDDTALDALASVDPETARGVRQQKFQNEQTLAAGRRADAGLDIQRENLSMRKQEFRAGIEAAAAKMSAAEREAEAQNVEKGLSGAAFFYQKGDKAGYEQFLSQNQIDPKQFPFEQFPAYAAQFGEAIEVLRGFEGEGDKPSAELVERQQLALAGGLVPGSEPYQNFMLTGDVPADAPAPLTQAAKLAADHKAGLIDDTTYEAALRKATAQDGLVLETTPEGGVRFGQGAGVDAATTFAPNESESKSAIYFTRATGALKDFEPKAEQMADFYQKNAQKMPLIGNYMVSEDYQTAMSAGREFLAAILRKDTGAAIQQFEIEEYGEVYFPQPGDGPETIEHKKKARARAVQALKAGMDPEQILSLGGMGIASEATTGGFQMDAETQSIFDKYSNP